MASGFRHFKAAAYRLPERLAAHAAALDAQIEALARRRDFVYRDYDALYECMEEAERHNFDAFSVPWKTTDLQSRVIILEGLKQTFPTARYHSETILHRDKPDVVTIRFFDDHSSVLPQNPPALAEDFVEV